MVIVQFKGECNENFKKHYIMDENDSLSKYNKIPLGHNRTNGSYCWLLQNLLQS